MKKNVNSCDCRKARMNSTLKRLFMFLNGTLIKTLASATKINTTIFTVSVKPTHTFSKQKI